MSGTGDLTARINQAKANIERARQVLVEAGEIPKSIQISGAKGALELINGGISKTQLEARLIASGWYDVHGGQNGNQRVIWTNPSLNESVRIMTDEQGSSYARVYNGPTGGGQWGSEWDPNAKNGKGGWTPALVKGEQPLKLDDTTGKVVTGSKGDTHPPLLPDPPKTPGASSFTESSGRSILRGAGRALGPAGALLDAYSLKEAYDADGGTIGENVQSTAGGIAGGWAGAAAGAAIGSAVLPGVGTVIGGAIGGIAGSSAGSKIAEGIGNLFD